MAAVNFARHFTSGHGIRAQLMLHSIEQWEVIPPWMDHG